MLHVFGRRFVLHVAPSSRLLSTMTQTSNKTMPFAHGPNSCQYEAQTPRGGYRIQIAWPLCWSEGRTRPKDDYPVSTL